MITKNIAYKETRNLLLQGYPVKLPKWKGYWKMNNGIIEAHLDSGEVEEASDVMATLHDNWIIATKENCPVLKEEIEGGNKNKQDFEIVDVDIEMIRTPFGLSAVPTVTIIEEHKSTITTMSKDSFIEFIGDENKALGLVKEFTSSKINDVFESIEDEIKNSDKEEEFEDILDLLREMARKVRDNTNSKG